MAGVTPRPTPADLPQTRRPDRRGTRAGTVVVAAFLVLYIVHFGVQSGVGIWGPTRLLELGYSTATASLVISGYWMAMVIGRFAVAPIAARVPPSVLVTVSCVGTAVATGISLHEPVTPWAYVVAGAFIGPIFPNGLTWLARTGHAQGSAFAYVIAAAMAGAAIFPPLLGLIIGGFGAGALAPALTAMSVLAVAACVVILVGTRRNEGASSRTPGSDDNSSNADRTIMATTGGRHPGRPDPSRGLRRPDRRPRAAGHPHHRPQRRTDHPADARGDAGRIDPRPA
jgi:MFS family permease